MTTEEIERAAEAVLESVPPYVWDGKSLPVPVEDIADSHFGLLVCEIDDLANVPGAPDPGTSAKLSGLLLPEAGQIWVCAEEAKAAPPRRRFTICHELGHWCLHRDGAEAVYCRGSVVQEEDPDERPPLPAIEEEANAFGAALLMPAKLLREYYRRDAAFEFHEACRIFGASGAAMGRRLHAVI